ncbi:MAG: CaiB/BaiF CoA-transferase family protein [Nocardioidaceae bacterium]
MSSGPGPLAGVRVVELAGIGPAPFACMLLAELGADVVRVERPRVAGQAGPPEVLSRGRDSLVVDLRQPQGRDVVLRLVDGADVLVEGMRPGVTERLGLGPEDCRARNPGLVYARMTGWGQQGPLAHTAGHDINYAALAGALHVTGSTDKPRQAVNLVADFGGGALYLVMGVLAALHERTASGSGQVVDVAMVDGAASLMTMVFGLHAVGHWQDRREANLLDGGAPFYDTYRCADGRHVAVGALERPFYAALLAGLGLDDDPDDPDAQYDRSSWPALRARLEAAFATRSRDDWAEVFAGTDACVTPVLSLAEAPRHPHHVSRSTFAAVAAGHQPAVAPRFSRTPGQRPGPPRRPGGDSTACLVAAGFTPDEVAALVDSGVVQQT